MNRGTRWRHVPLPGGGAREHSVPTGALLAPVAVLCATAAVLARRGHPPTRVAVPLALAVTVPWLLRWRSGALHRAATRVGRAAGGLVGVVLFTLLGVLVVVLPWAVQRAVRLDPLPAGGRWDRRARRATMPARPWTHDALLRPDRRPRRRLLLPVAVVVALVAGTPTGRLLVEELTGRAATAARPFRLRFADPFDDVRSSSTLGVRDPVDPDLAAFHPGPDDPQAAMADAEWFNDEHHYNTAQGWALDPAAAWRPVNPYRLLDFRSKHLNVVDGARLSWTPPPCDCPRLRVWMYGGSTTYGLNQRDDHTIASELARVAHEHGYAIDISNRGANGHLHWMEAERFAWDLTVEDPPDLVLFYDGVNDAWAGAALGFVGSGDIRPMQDPTTMDVWNDTGRSDPPRPPAPPGGRFIGWPTDLVLPFDEVPELVVDRYDRSRSLSRAAARAHGVPVRYFWQPTRYSRPLVPSEPHEDGDTENRNRYVEELMREHLPDDVIDVADALRVTDEPLFTDDVHHNEKGARLVAEEMFERLERDVARLVRSKGRR